MKKFLYLLLLFGGSPSFALEGGISADTIEVRPSFDGAELTLFGALENNANPNDKIFILIEGPKRNITLWQKKRVAGVWVNANKKTFSNMGGFYFLLSNRKIESPQRAIVMREIGSQRDRKIISRLLEKRDLFSLQEGAVELLGARLFRAKVNLPPSAPIGKYIVRIMHFRANALVKEVLLPLNLSKTGWGQRLFWFAQEWSFFYGLFAVALALFIGWGMTELLRRLT